MIGEQSVASFFPGMSFVLFFLTKELIMGYYINRVGDQNLPATGKAKWLMTLADAKPAELPVKFQPNLVCVVEI